MAVFDKRINNCVRLDWRILMNGSVSLYHDIDTLNEDIQWLENESYQLHIFDFHIIKTSEEFHKVAKEKLKFPDYYGENLAAFRDCLINDLQIPEDGGTAVVFKGFDEYYRSDEDYAHEILERLDETSRKQMLYGRRFLTLLQIDDKSTLIKEIGQHTVVWNICGK